MGFLQNLLGLTDDRIQECWPGGKALQVHIEFNQDKGRFTYYGRYGLRCKFFLGQFDRIEIASVSSTHGVVQVYGQGQCLATFDLMPYDACEATRQWLLKEGQLK